MAGPFFSKPDTARTLGISVRTLERLEARGLISSTRFPSGAGERSWIRYSQQEIAAFIKSGYQPRTRAA